MDDERAGHCVLRVEHVEPRAARRYGDRAGVADLSTGLRVERSAIEDHVDGGTGLGAVRALPRDDQAQHPRVRRVLLPAGELGRSVLVDQLAIQLDRSGGRTAGLLVRGLRPRSLLLHARVETFEIDRSTALARDLAREIDREPEGVVQAEPVFARDVAPFEDLVEQLEPALERRPKAGLFPADGVDDQLAVLGDRRVRARERRDRRVDHCRGDEVVHAEQVRVTNRAPDDPAQHVTPFLVRRHHTVADENGDRAGVLREDAQRHVAFGAGVAAVAHAGEIFGHRDQRPHQLGLPHRLDTLQGRETTLDAGTGVDARLRQRNLRTVRERVVLHEHEVPELDVAVLVDGRATSRAELGAHVDEDLRVVPAGPGIGHAPEVRLVSEPLDPLDRQPDDVAPDRGGIVVGGVHRDPEQLRIEAPHPRHQLPRPRDRLGLEVVAEAEVPHHLEEREVPVGAADVVEVVVLAAGADALLDRDRARVRRRLVADEVGLERHHARDGEEHGAIDRERRSPTARSCGRAAKKSFQLWRSSSAVRGGVDIGERLAPAPNGPPTTSGAQLVRRCRRASDSMWCVERNLASRSRIAARPSDTAVCT